MKIIKIGVKRVIYNANEILDTNNLLKLSSLKDNKIIVWSEELNKHIIFFRDEKRVSNILNSQKILQNIDNTGLISHILVKCRRIKIRLRNIIYICIECDYGENFNDNDIVVPLMNSEVLSYMDITREEISGIVYFYNNIY